MVMHCGLTQRESGRRLGLRAGSSVGYQMLEAERQLAMDKVLARRTARIVARCSV